MAVRGDIVSVILAIALLVVPLLIGILGLFGVITYLRGIFAIVRVSPKEFLFLKVKAVGEKLTAKINGKKQTWTINSEPYLIKGATFFGTVPMYKASLSNAKTEDFDKDKTASTTPEELNMIEEQSVLKQLFSSSNMDSIQIMLMIGAVALGGLIGYIAGSQITMNNIKPVK